jgi:Flavin containing amine oxidoreductase
MRYGPLIPVFQLNIREYLLKLLNLLIAKDRVGGRIFTKGYGNFNFDFGAQWIHGQKGNKLYDFAVQHDLISSQQSEGEGNQIEMLNCLNTKISGLQECIWSKEGKRSIRHWLKT